MPTLKGTLPKGLKLGDKLLREFEIRPATTRDMVRAEDAAPMDRKFAYRLALAGQQLISLGELTGPLDLERMQDLDPEDVQTILAKQSEVEALEKKPSSGDEATNSSSPA